MRNITIEIKDRFLNAKGSVKGISALKLYNDLLSNPNSFTPNGKVKMTGGGYSIKFTCNENHLNFVTANYESEVTIYLYKGDILYISQ